MKPKEEKTGSKNGTSELMNKPNVHPSFLLPAYKPKISLHLKSSFLIHIFMILLKKHFKVTEVMYEKGEFNLVEGNFKDLE